MKLIVDNESNVETLEIKLVSDIAAMARRFADAVEAGEYGDVITAMILIDTPDNLHTETWGENLSRYESLGFLEFAKRAIFDD